MGYLDTIREKREIQAVKTEAQPVVIKNDDYIKAGEVRALLAELQGIRREFSAIKVALAKPGAEPEKLAPHFAKLGDRLTKALTDQKQPIIQSPEVKITEKTVDMANIERLLADLISLNQPTDKPAISTSTDYSKCRACDLDNAPGGTQYIGFIDQTGKWYIMQNDTENNTIRYHYGTGDYEAAWNERHGLVYGLPGAGREV